jgi:hypothetical protein
MRPIRDGADRLAFTEHEPDSAGRELVRELAARAPARGRGRHAGIASTSRKMSLEADQSLRARYPRESSAAV